MPAHLFCVDNKGFIGDFSVMRLLLKATALFAFAAVLSAADQGKQLIRDIITEKDLNLGIIANARNPEYKEGLRKELLAKSPDSPKAVDAFVDSADLIVSAEVIQDGHRLQLRAVVGSITPRSRAFLLSQGVPAALIESTAAVISVKLDGADLKGDALDALAEELSKKTPEEDKDVLTQDESSLVNLAFDKDVDLVLIIGRKSKEWGEVIEKISSGQGGVLKRIEATKASIRQIVAVGMKKDGLSVAFLVALGEMNEKVRATLLASGIPEGLIDTKAAFIGVSVNNVQLKGDELDEFAEAIKTARDKKAPPPSLKSLADLSK